MTAPAKKNIRPAPEASLPRANRKQDILLAAEKLFASHGYHGVSIRDIAAEAQVPLNLVRHHFGQKHELYHAIFEHWSDMIQERLALLEDAKSSEGDRLANIVEAFVAPVIRLRASEEGESYALLMTRGLAQQNEEEEPIIREFFDPMAKAFIDALRSALEHEFGAATQPQVAWCYQFGLGALLHHISDGRVQRLSGGKNKPSDPAAMPLLVAFIAEGMRGVMRKLHPPPARPARR